MDMWTVSRVWNMVRRNMFIQNTHTNRMILERKLSRFTISFWFILLLLMTVIHCISWHNAGIAEDLFPWRSTEHRCLADYMMVLFLQSLHGADIWWYLGNPLDAFSFLFSLSCIKQCILKREALVLSGEPSLSTDNSCSAKDSLKMLMKEVFVWKINLACLTRFIS